MHEMGKNLGNIEDLINHNSRKSKFKQYENVHVFIAKN